MVLCGCTVAFLSNRQMEKLTIFAIGLLFVVVGSLRISLSVTAATIPKNMNTERGKMSKLDDEYDLEKGLRKKEKVFVLFYASWCPFSRRFLPVFEKYSKTRPQICMQVKIDDKAKLTEKYSIDVVPTVLVFEMGTVTKRLDGEPGAGLDENQFKKLLTER